MVKSLIALVIVVAVILGGAKYVFPKLTKPDLSNRGEPVQCASVPEFSQYPPVATFEGTMPLVAWDSNKMSRQLESEILAASASASNFAGQYLLINTACGADCTQHTVLHVPTGNITLFGLESQTGVSFQKDSELLVVNPSSKPGYSTLYYKFNGILNYICETK